jgi:hypothetical protein
MAVLVVKPRIVRANQSRAPLIAIVAIVASWLVVGHGTLRGDAVWPMVGLGLGLMMGPISWLAVRRAELRLADGVLSYGGLMGVRKLGDSTSLARVVKVTIVGLPDQAAQVWAGAGTSVVLMERSWGVAELDALSQQLGLEVTSEPEPKTWAQIHDTYPGSIPWFLAHANRVGLAVGGLICLGIVIWASIR